VLFFELFILSTQSSTLRVLTFKLTLQIEVSIVREKLNYLKEICKKFQEPSYQQLKAFASTSAPDFKTLNKINCGYNK